MPDEKLLTPAQLIEMQARDIADLRAAIVVKEELIAAHEREILRLSAPVGIVYDLYDRSQLPTLPFRLRYGLLIPTTGVGAHTVLACEKRLKRAIFKITEEA